MIITSTDKKVFIEVDGVKKAYPLNYLCYEQTSNGVTFFREALAFYTKPIAAVTVNGTQLTSDNADSLLDPLFNTGSGGGVTLPIQITDVEGLRAELDSVLTKEVIAAANSAISVNTVDKISTVGFNIDANDKVLTQSAVGMLSHLSITIDAETGRLSLIGNNDEEISFINLPVDQFLKSVQIVVDPEGQPAGTYMEFVFVTSEGENTVYINLNSLIILYTSGNSAIAVSEDYKISLVLDSNSNLIINDNGLGLAEGYTLMTTGEKTKLSGIDTGAQVNTVTSVNNKTGVVVLNKDDVGLGNVDNTSDVNKPVSTLQQTAIDTAINNILVPGNNILRGSSTGTGWTYTRFNSNTFESDNSSTGESYIQNNAARLSLYTGQKLYLSFEYKVTSNVLSTEFFLLGSANVFRYDLANFLVWRKESIEFTVPTGWGDIDNPITSAYIRFDNNGSTDGSTATLSVRNIQLRILNKDMDWSPALEDIQSQMKSLSDRITALGG